MRDTYKAATIAWLRKVLSETGLSPSELAKLAKVSSTTLTRPLNNPDHPHAIGGRTIAKVARAVGRDPPAHLTSPEAGNDKAESPPALIPEYDARAAAGGGANNHDEGVMAHWPFSREALDQ